MSKQLINKLFITALFCLAFTTFAFAQTATGKISGKVIFGSDGSPLHNSSIQIVQTKQTTIADDNGYYEFTNVPAGRYTILVHQEGFADATRSEGRRGGEEGRSRWSPDH